MAVMNHCAVVALVFLIVGQLSPLPALKFRSQRVTSDVRGECPETCHCDARHHVVECSRHSLTYIPKLPWWTKELIFAGNYLPTVTSYTFANVSGVNITSLSLANNSIMHISEDAFQKFDNLLALNLARNDVNHTDLKATMYTIGRLPKLQNLVLAKMHLNYIPDDFWDGLNGSSIQVLWIYHNSLHRFDLTRLSGMRNIRVIDLAGNLVSSFITRHDATPRIDTLNLRYNDFHFIPDICWEGKPFFPRLKYLDMGFNNLWYVQPRQINCAKRLEYLELSGNCIQQFKPGFLTGMDSLKKVELNYLRTKANVPRDFISLGNPPNIEYISMINAEIRVGHDNISTDFFEGCESLLWLYLGRNFFSRASDDFFFELFRPLKNLHLLDLSSCELHRIPKAVIEMKSLTEIWLFDNYIIQWPGCIFQGLPFLKNISLDVNQIANVKEDAFPVDLRNDLTALNLSVNPFSCTCDILWFLNWMRSNATLFTGGLENYRCASPEEYRGRTLLSLPFTETSCLVSHEISVMIIVVLGLVICLAGAAPLLYRYRWHLQSVMFMIRYQTLRQEARHERRDYEYDAFLIYGESDGRRVWHEFMPRLERDRHLHLCIHERDFLPGKWIMDNIVDCMLASRRVVVLLSNAMATSEWCQFEMNLAHAEVTRSGAAPLVLLLLEDINPHNMTPSLYAVLKTTTYLRFPALPQDVEAFWQQVYQTLADS